MRTIRHHLKDERGQAAVEFAIILPLVLFLLFAIIEFGRAFNAYNDLNQIAADGARMAAVNRLPSPPSQLITDQADTAAVRDAGTVTVTYPAGCAVGGYVHVQAQSPFTFLAFLDLGTITLRGSAEMRIEQAPTGGC